MHQASSTWFTSFCSLPSCSSLPFSLFITFITRYQHDCSLWLFFLFYFDFVTVSVTYRSRVCSCFFFLSVIVSFLLVFVSSYPYLTIWNWYLSLLFLHPVFSVWSRFVTLIFCCLLFSVSDISLDSFLLFEKKWIFWSYFLISFMCDVHDYCSWSLSL